MLWVALAGPGRKFNNGNLWTIVYSNQQLVPNVGQEFISVLWQVWGIQH